MQCVHPANAISKSLTALREFVYNSTEDASPTVNIPISEMKKAIVAKRITIVGGNETGLKASTGVPKLEICQRIRIKRRR